MKKILLLAFLIAMPFVCPAQSAKIRVGELPKDAQLFLQQFYKHRPIASITKKEESPLPYEVRLAQGTAIRFTLNGDWKEVDGDGASLPKALIPQYIADYIKTNYPKKRVTYIERGASGIAVNLNGKVGLEFDSKGQLLQ